MNSHILIVDDEQSIIDLLRLVLEREGLSDIAEAATAAAAVESVRACEPALIVLDVMLPDGDGFALAGVLRTLTAAPILFLTARSTDLDKLTGFGVGGDDYVTKPFNPRALVARVKAILRRTDGTVRLGRPIEVGPLRIDPRRREALLDGRALELRAREFDLLAALAREPGAVLGREALLEDVWGTDFPGETRTVDVHVSELRKKLGPDGPAIESVRGIGYRLVPPPEHPGPASSTPDDPGGAA